MSEHSTAFEKPTVAAVKYSAPALEKGLDILELLSRRSQSLTLSQIAAALGRSVNELFRMVQVLEARGYVANSMSAAVLVFIFAAGCGVIFLPTYLVASRARPALPGCELLITFWFVLCGCIHLFFEGM